MNLHLVLTTCGFLLGAGVVCPLADAPSLRYDLRPGDRLVYRESFEQDIDGRSPYGYRGAGKGPSTGRQVGFRAEWESHLIVSSRDDGGTTVGFQRRLRLADVRRYRVDGDDRLTPVTADSLLARAGVARDGPFAHASRFDALGRSLLPATLVREWPASKVLWGALEVLPLPDGEGEPGDTWEGRRGLEMGFRAEAWEELADPVARERCLRIRGTGDASSLLGRPAGLGEPLRLLYWFCPGTGSVARVELTASYPSALYERVDERVVLERTGRWRGESESEWLSAERTRHGALAARLVRPEPAPWPGDLDSLYLDPDPEVRRRSLALAWRSGRVPKPELLPPPADGDIVQRRLVRKLAASSDPGAGASAKGEETGGRDSLAPGDACRRPGERLARMAAGEARSGAPEKPGTTLRGMQTPGREGWPYALHVPLDYRGDELHPLIVYLAGNRGSAVEGALLGESGLAGREFLVAYPHADGMWWEEDPTAIVDALLTEITVRYNVDPDRIYLSGLSNGGTGAYYYAARWPHRFTAAVASMGGGQYAPYLSSGRLPPEPRNLMHLPLLFLHGARDRTIPASYSRRTAALSREFTRTAPAEIHVFPDRGHGIVPGRGDDGRTVAFFRRFRHRVVPRRLAFRLRQPPAGRHYWLETTPTAGAGAVEGEAEIRTGGEVRVRTAGARQIRVLLAPELLPQDRRVVVRWNGRSVYDGEVRPDCRLLERSFRETGDPHLAYAAAVRVSLPGTYRSGPDASPSGSKPR